MDGLGIMRINPGLLLRCVDWDSPGRTGYGVFGIEFVGHREIEEFHLEHKP